MCTDLDHLPSVKRRELELIVRILFEEFEDALSLGTQDWKKQGRILKIILFGSYARGDWVNDPVGGYISDYDLLVVVNHDRLTDTADYWAKADEHLLREYSITHKLTAPANFIVHTLADVNDQLQRGRYFFTDIVKDGIALYEALGAEFVKPEPLSPEQARAEATAYFEKWMPSSAIFLRMHEVARGEGHPSEAAFALHQAAERLYHCVLLTLTLYSPKSHRLTFLRAQAERIAPELAGAWPRGTKFERRCFEQLVRAYVDARYSPHYAITADELAWAAEHVHLLQSLVHEVCADYLETGRRASLTAS
jgi:predicted nucleotidyltransferase/HEPN domain-containing protein